MGNSQKKPTNHFKVTLSLRNFAIRRLPQKPSTPTAQRIDERTWSEFINSCNDAGILPDALERRSEYGKWQCYFYIGITTMIVGLFLGIGLGLGGGLSANTVMWVSAIVFGTGGFVGGILLFIVPATKFGEISEQFIQDVGDKLNSNLMALNNKYNGMIRFSVKKKGIGNIFQSEQNADSSYGIGIEIEVLAENVPYIPSYGGQRFVLYYLRFA